MATGEALAIGKRLRIWITEPDPTGWKDKDGLGYVAGVVDRAVRVGNEYAFEVLPKRPISFGRLSAPDWMMERYGVRLLGEVIAKRLWLIARHSDEMILDVLEGKEIHVNIAIIPPSVDITSQGFRPKDSLIGVGHGLAVIEQQEPNASSRS